VSPSPQAPKRRPCSYAAASGQAASRRARRLRVLRGRSARNWFRRPRETYELSEMGGTGLDPVTPSLSSRHPRSRPLTAAYSFSLLCSDFNFDTQTVFALVCTLSRRLVVARG